jgi:hypothetical protein
MLIGFATAIQVVLVTAAIFAWNSSQRPGFESCGCGTLLMAPATRQAWPAWVFGSTSLVFAAIGGWSLFRHARRDQALQLSFQKLGRRVWSPVLQRRLWLVEAPQPIAVTLGLLQSEIYISTSLSSLLSQDEQAAVLRHEQQHLVRHDPLMNAGLVAIDAAFGWLPWVKTWRQAALAEQEISADKAASRHGQVSSVASALVKLHAQPQPVGAWWSALSIRVDTLLDPAATKQISFRHFWRSVMAASAVIGFVAIVGIISARSVAAKIPPSPRCVETRLWCAERQQQTLNLFVPRMSTYVLP